MIRISVCKRSGSRQRDVHQLLVVALIVLVYKCVVLPSATCGWLSHAATNGNCVRLHLMTLFFSCMCADGMSIGTHQCLSSGLERT